jgi:hypothetical protein
VQAAPRHTFSANVTQWAMYDAYAADLARQAAAKDVKKKRQQDKEKVSRPKLSPTRVPCPDP